MNSFPYPGLLGKGCPLSMALFIIFQEPFYGALVSSRIIRPLTLPGNQHQKLIGYADDTNIVVRDSNSLLEINKIIASFEVATGVKLNRNQKTKIIGLGQWKNRQQWPLDWLKSETDFLFTLGIYHGNDFTATLEKNWSLTLSKIQSHVNILFNRKISLFQRAAYANSCILSKVWYVCHVYPLTGIYVKDINRILFNYIWCGRYEPIRRTTVFKPKGEGGLRLINCGIKSKVLLANSFLKCYSDDEYKNPLMIHYCYLKMNNSIPKHFSVHDAAIISPPYYQAIMSIIDKFLHFSTFPIIPNKKMYSLLSPKEKPIIENLYPQFKWKHIWSNFCDLKIYPFDKDIIYKHLHVTLATNTRLAMLNVTDSNKCNLCRDGKEQTALHMLYECTYISPFYHWFLNILMQICSFNPSSNIRFLYFDSFYQDLYQKRISNLFLVVYICTVWRTRKENLRIGNLRNILIRTVKGNIDVSKQLTRKSLEELYGQYCERLTYDELDKL